MVKKKDTKTLADGSIQSTIQGIRTFEFTQYVTGFLEGQFEDWPDNIQDIIYEAVERKAQQVELPLTIVHSGCYIDYGEAMDRSQDRFYVQVILSEVVVADEREIDKQQIQKAILDMMHRKTVH